MSDTGACLQEAGRQITVVMDEWLQILSGMSETGGRGRGHRVSYPRSLHCFIPCFLPRVLYVRFILAFHTCVSWMRSGSILAVICLQSAALQVCLQSMYHASTPAEGPVRRYRPELEEEPIAGGYAVGCVSYPVSDTFHICFIPRGGLSHALSSRSTRW